MTLMNLEFTGSLAQRFDDRVKQITNRPEGMKRRSLASFHVRGMVECGCWLYMIELFRKLCSLKLELYNLHP
jgi:hypothetical protein